jgi:hypothetical protein
VKFNEGEWDRVLALEEIDRKGVMSEAGRIGQRK